MGDIRRLFKYPERSGKLFAHFIMQNERYWNGELNYNDLSFEKLRITVKMSNSRLNEIRVEPYGSGASMNHASRVQDGLEKILGR